MPPCIIEENRQYAPHNNNQEIECILRKHHAKMLPGLDLFYRSITQAISISFIHLFTLWNQIDTSINHQNAAKNSRPTEQFGPGKAAVGWNASL